MEFNARYASYLLRLRQVRSDDKATWLASVKNVDSGEQRLFPSIDALITFLLAEYGTSVLPIDRTARPGREDAGRGAASD